MSFFEELKRRNVFRVGIAYVVASWVVLQVADLVFEAISAPEWVLQALLALVVLGFFAAVIIAWAYELTPEGVKRESEVDRSQSVTLETAHKLNRITIGLLVVVVALVAVERFVLPEREMGSEPFSPDTPAAVSGMVDEERALTPATAETDELPAGPSVAVLPFVNMSSDPEQEFFSDGISEEILNVLTRIPNLKVAARTSSFQFKGQNLDIAHIARQLKVNHILEGSVRKASNQLRITAQLIEAESGYHLWSDTFDRQLEDVFAIQDEIAGAIAGELRTRLAGDSLVASNVVNMEAYELFLKGRGLVAARNETNLLAGIELLQAAIEIEPDYAEALGTLAKAHVVLPFYTRAVAAGEMREQARAWAQRALALDPNNVEALSSLAIVYAEVDIDHARGLELLRKAVTQYPGSVAANNFLGDLALRTGDLDSALIYETRAAELDPLAPVHLSDLAAVYLLKGDYEKVLNLSGRALELDPQFPHAFTFKGNAWFALGREEDLAESLERPDRLDPVRQRLTLHVARGEREAAAELLDTLVQGVEAGQRNPVDVARDAVLFGDFDAAGELLLRAYDEKDGTWTFPSLIRLPEQAPDSAPWQEFWALPGPARLAEIRRRNGLSPQVPGFGEGRTE